MRGRNFRCVFPLLLVAAVAGCAGQTQQAPPVVDTAAAMAAVDSINTAYMAAMAGRDTNAVNAMYTDDAYMLAPGMPAMIGHDAIRAGWAGFMATPGLDLNFTSSKKIVSQAGDLVIDIGSYVMKSEGPKGKPMEDVGKYATIFQKTDGGWKILVDTFNSDKEPGK